VDKDNENHHPVYLTIAYDSIDFYVHYYCRNGERDEHMHNVILSLPLSINLDVKDGLTEVLVEGWKTNFPRCNDGSCKYLYEKLEKDIGYGFCYAKLRIFNENNQSVLEEAIEKEKSKDFSTFTQKFIRTLILDFLFDLEHTNVFKTSPHYEHISIKLKENYFFSALAAKANFYYSRENLIEVLEGISIYIEDYLNAEMQWTKHIRSQKANHYFNDFREDWFADPETEMNDVYDSKFKQIQEIEGHFSKKINNEKFIKEVNKCRKLTKKWYGERFKWIKIFGLAGFNHFWHCLPFVIAILTAWILTIIGSDLLPAYIRNPTDEHIFARKNNVHWIILGFSFIISTIVLSFKIHSKNQAVKWQEGKWHWIRIHVERPLICAIICLLMSIILGCFLCVFTNEYVMPWDDLHSDQLSPFFLICCSLSLFIGVVLKLVTDEKYTEES
jgi:hypothetical protein